MNRLNARKKAEELVGQMTLEEKVSQILFVSPAIERLGIHPYNWWNEALHGVAREDIATVFPQSIGLAATFNPEIIGEMGEVIATEGRIKHRESAKYGDYGQYKGLTFWSPNINIFRDPRWGRGQETYGEDPFLTGSIGCEFVKGLQGDGEFLKSAACAKHFAVHSGPEKDRHGFNAVVSKKEMWETYLPAFQMLVTEAGVESVMGAYNRTNGEPTCAHSYLMDEVLRKMWKFQGYFVSDCGAIDDFHNGHNVTKTPAESTALALKHGCNVNCGETYSAALDAVKQGILDEKTITENAIQAYTTRALLGEFEDRDPFEDIPFEKLDCKEHKELNREIARESIVLLKNDGILPLNKKELKSIAVIGPNANNISMLSGNYFGVASQYVTTVDGIRAEVGEDVRINYATGCFHLVSGLIWDSADTHVSAALTAAEHSEVVVMCMGINASIEGEEMPGSNGYSDGGDRLTVSLPEVQLDLIRKVCEVNDNVILVYHTGSPVDIGAQLRGKVRAIVEAWYPGAQGGTAVADMLFGKYSPSGRLPITFPDVEEVLPDIKNYSMKGRTYRYSTTTPAFPFGYGLGYTDVCVEKAEVVSMDWDKAASVKVMVKNNGKMESQDIVQVYAQFTDSRTSCPNYQLCGIKKIKAAVGETIETTINIPSFWMKAVNEDGERIVPDGNVNLFVGFHQPDDYSNQLTGTKCVKISIK